MRSQHEIPKGIICEKCSQIATKGNYTRIQYSRPKVEDTTGVNIAFSRMNLCNKCFEEYKQLIQIYTGKEFIQNSEKIKSIKKVRPLK